MAFGTMSVIILFILIITDALRMTVRAIGLPKYCLFYFLICQALLQFFEIKPIPELEFNVAFICIALCLIILESDMKASLVEDFSCEEQGRGKHTFLAIIIIGIVSALVNYLLESNETALLITALLPSLIALRRDGLFSAMTVAAVAPFVAELMSVVYEFASTGYGAAVIGSRVVDVQLLGLLLTCVVNELKGADILNVKKTQYRKGASHIEP